MPFVYFDCPCGTHFAIHLDSPPPSFCCPICSAVLDFKLRPARFRTTTGIDGTYETVLVDSVVALPVPDRVRLAWHMALDRTRLLPAELLQQLIEFPLASDLAAADQALAIEQGLAGSPAVPSDDDSPA